MGGKDILGFLEALGVGILISMRTCRPGLPVKPFYISPDHSRYLSD